MPGNPNIDRIIVKNDKRLKIGGKVSRLIFAGIVLFSSAICIAAEPNIMDLQDRVAVLHETAQSWIQVGIAQLKKGLYEQAEKSFLAAREYQEYLSADEHMQLEKNLSDTQQAIVERQPVMEHIKKARELTTQNQPVEARAHFETIRKNQYLTEQERKQVEQEIKTVDNNFDSRKTELMDVYNRSVELYRQGEIERARDGFVEVSRYGMLIMPEGQTAKDYLVQIDGILTERMKKEDDANGSVSSLNAINEETKQKPALETEVTLLRPDEDRISIERLNKKQQQGNQLSMISEQATEKPEVNKEIVTENEQSAIDGEGARIKIARTYTRAVIEDTQARVEYYLSRGELDKALGAVRVATDVVRENRILIGDELFSKVSIQLKQLAEKIIQARRES